MSALPDPIDVRTRILHQATRLFATHGYAATAIEEIAQAAGIKRPTLVYHFGSKPQLRDAVLGALMTHWRDELPRLLAAATTGSDRLRSGFMALVSFFRDDRHRARLLIREMLDRPEEMTALFKIHLHPLTALVTDYIRQGQAEGRIRAAVDPEAFVVHLVNAVISTTALTELPHLVAPAPDEERELAELFRIVRTSLFNESIRGSRTPPTAP
ncbi:MAG: helix-turn-helix domain-containing protein [Myxococcota bacterium]